MSTSSTIASGVVSSTRSSASLPSTAVCTSYPSKRSARSTASRTCGSSSTTSTRPFCRPADRSSRLADMTSAWHVEVRADQEPSQGFAVSDGSAATLRGAARLRARNRWSAHGIPTAVTGVSQAGALRMRHARCEQTARRGPRRRRGGGGRAGRVWRRVESFRGASPAGTTTTSRGGGRGWARQRCSKLSPRA